MSARRKGLCLLVAAMAVAWPRPAAPSTSDIAPPADSPVLWFPVGEGLVYQLRWGVVPVGKARAKTGWIRENGRLLLAIRYRAKTNHLFDALYPVDDFAESIVDPATFLPLRFTIRQMRRHAECDETTVFDRARAMAKWESRLTGKSHEFAIEPDSRDILSFMYFLRKDGLKPDEDRIFRVMADDRLFDIRVRTFKPETVRLPPYGRVDALKVEPEVNFKGLMIEHGSVTMWAAQDARRLGVQLVVRGSLASVWAALCSVEGPGDDSWIQATNKASREHPFAGDADVENTMKAAEQLDAVP